MYCSILSLHSPENKSSLCIGENVIDETFMFLNGLYGPDVVHHLVCLSGVASHNYN